MCRMVRRGRILVVLVRGGAQVGRSERVHHQRSALIDERDTANTDGRARRRVVALEGVKRRGAGKAGAGRWDRTAGRPGWTGDAAGRVALLGWLDDGVAAHLRPCRCHEHRQGGDGEQSNEATEYHDNDLLLSWKRTLTRLAASTSSQQDEQRRRASRPSHVAPGRSTGPRTPPHLCHTVPIYLITSRPEGGVDAIERAAIREEVNAWNRETLPLPSRYDLSATTNVVRSPSSADCEDMQRGLLAGRWRQERTQIAPQAAASHPQRRPVARTASLRRS